MKGGQILETHLGWASKELGRSIARLLNQNGKAEAIRRWFREVFSDTAIWKTLVNLDDETLLEYADRFREGIPMATPVFDGARKTEIRHLLEVAGTPNAGKDTRWESRTGEDRAEQVAGGCTALVKSPPMFA